MADAPEPLKHPLFGTLGWHEEYHYWITEYRLPCGRVLDVHIHPDTSDRHAFIKPAADLFCWALENERVLFQEAARTYLLELYNDGWRQDGEPELTEDEFAAQLEWQLLQVNEWDTVRVEFCTTTSGCLEDTR